jgi:hypothetical protein
MSLGLAGLNGACNPLFGIDDLVVGNNGAGGTGDPIGVIYVSAAGDDANDGLTQSAPKKTIAAAIADAAVRPEVTEIRVCEGQYLEFDLDLAIPASLLGGFECASWERSKGYGYPTFDAMHETIVENGDALSTSNTLRVRGASLGREVRIDGLTVLGAPKSPDGSAGLVLRDGAGVTVSNNRIDGGAAEIVSYGMIIDERASPHVFHNEIDGGTGAVSGSIGLLVSSPDAGSPCIEENVIGGGAGMAETAASQGLVILDANLKDAPGCPVRGNTIDGGSGTAKEGAHSVGVHVTGSSVVDLVDNAIDGGSGTGEISGPVGVFIAGSASVHVDSNRVFAGRHSMAGGAYAVIANAGTSVVITNNFISGGRAEGEGIKGAVGILLSGCTSASVQHNTVFGGLPQTPRPKARRVSIWRARSTAR